MYPFKVAAEYHLRECNNNYRYSSIFINDFFYCYSLISKRARSAKNRNYHSVTMDRRFARIKTK